MTQVINNQKRWVIVDNQAQFSDAILARASEHQSTLLNGLEVLRALRFNFPRTVEPDTAQRWIDEGGQSFR